MMTREVKLYLDDRLTLCM